MLYLLKHLGSYTYDELNVIIIRANSESEARLIASSYDIYHEKIWLNHETSSCQLIETSGAPGIILTHHY